MENLQPNTTQPPPPQPIATHAIPITESTKNKGKWKENQTKNQPKTINEKPKLKLKTQNQTWSKPDFMLSEVKNNNKELQD